MRHLIRACLSLLLLMLPLATLTRPIVAQATAVAYDHPLAYVGQDDGLYITSLDGTRVTLVASASATTDNGFPNVYSTPRWSPQGTQLAFIDDKFTGSGSTLYGLYSGSTPTTLVTTDELGNRVLAWSPDGTQIAYVDGYAVESGTKLHILKADGTQDRAIAELHGGMIGDGFNPDIASRMLSEDRDEIINETTFTLDWTNRGLLTSIAGTGPTTLYSPDGKVIWQSDLSVEKFIVSPDKTRAVFSTYVLDNETSTTHPVMIDVATGHELSHSLPDGAEPLAWTADSKSVIYGTSTPLNTIDDPRFSPGNMVHKDFMLTLWRQGLNEKRGTRIIQVRGYDFGTVVVSPDSTTIVFSLISNGDIDKLNPPIQLVAVPLNGGLADYIAVGGKPAFGTEPFTAIPATPVTPPAQPQKCTNSLPSRLQIGQRSQVTPGAANKLRTNPVDGSVMTLLAPGAGFLVLKGPVCAADGLAWWMINYHGAIGWTVESDAKSYWLEP